jgi:SAM-dependent methyltransferase
LPLADSSFDGAINLFTSFGYFGEAGDVTMLGEMSRILRPGGHLVMDLMNPAAVRKSLVPVSRLDRSGWILEERRSLDDDGRRIVKDVWLRNRSGSDRAWREEVRLYEPDELRVLLEDQGLQISALHGSFDAEPFDPTSARQIIHARKR